MATTRTPGITVLADGRRFIDKRYLGIRIGLRVGAVTQEEAEGRALVDPSATSAAVNSSVQGSHVAARAIVMQK